MHVRRENPGELYSADGNVYQLEHLMREYGNDVLRTAYLYVKDLSSAEDIFQEVFLKVNQYLHTFEEQSSVKTWIIRITINLCKDYIKSAYQRKVVPMMEFKEDTLISEDIYGDIEKEETKQTVTDAVLQLPEHYKEVVLCVYYQEMSIHETAKSLHIPEGTVKSRLARAKEKLRINLEGRL